jgi:putative ABC transport system permease protein
MLKDFLMLAARSITHRKMRSWLTVIGVFIGITAVVALISIGLGLDETIKQQVAGVFGVDTFVLIPEEAFTRGGPRSSTEEYRLDLEYLKSVPGVKIAAAVRQQTAFVQGPSRADGSSTQGFLPVMGLSTELMTEFVSYTGELEVEPGGRLFLPGDTEVAVLGNEIAERLGAQVGDLIMVAGDENQELNLVIIGIMKTTDNQEETESGAGFATGMSAGQNKDTIYVPYDTMTLLWGEDKDVLVTLVRTQPGFDVNEVAQRVEKELTVRGSEISAITYSDISEAIGTMTSTVSAFLAGIAGIALLVGGVGVMNTMFTSVLERTKEIGVMKAVGAKNSHILTIFLIESGLMGLVGGIVGTLLGLGLSSAASVIIGRYFGIQMAVVASPSLIIITLIGSFSLGAFAGLWPAWRASRLPVVDALRYE